MEQRKNKEKEVFDLVVKYYNNEIDIDTLFVGFSIILSRRESQSLINQGNILTYKEDKVDIELLCVSVAIPYKSGKYSYTRTKNGANRLADFESQSLINQGNILTLPFVSC